jgi:hypothetical protein
MLRKYSGTLAGNYVMTTRSPTWIPYKGPCFAWHSEDGSTMIVVFQKNYNDNEMKYIAAMFSKPLLHLGLLIK